MAEPIARSELASESPVVVSPVKETPVSKSAYLKLLLPVVVASVLTGLAGYWTGEARSRSVQLEQALQKYFATDNSIPGKRLQVLHFVETMFASDDERLARWVTSERNFAEKVLKIKKREHEELKLEASNLRSKIDTHARLLEDLQSAWNVRLAKTAVLERKALPSRVARLESARSGVNAQVDQLSATLEEVKSEMRGLGETRRLDASRLLTQLAFQDLDKLRELLDRTVKIQEQSFRVESEVLHVIAPLKEEVAHSAKEGESCKRFSWRGKPRKKYCVDPVAQRSSDSTAWASRK